MLTLYIRVPDLKKHLNSSRSRVNGNYKTLNTSNNFLNEKNLKESKYKIIIKADTDMWVHYKIPLIPLLLLAVTINLTLNLLL